MVNKKYSFCIVFVTKDYYPMFDQCLWKYSRANYDDVLVLNVDLKSSKENLEQGKEICNKLNIVMIDEPAETCQHGLQIADQYLLDNNIDIDWMMSFQHDVFPMTDTFWDDLQSTIDDIKDKKVGMIGANCIMDYQEAIRNKSNLEHRKATRTARGNLQKNILKQPHAGWYRGLPEKYYHTKYFAVEAPYWTCFIINRELFRKHITVDYSFMFELWPDDFAHQFLSAGICNIAVPKLLVCHDHDLKVGINIKSGKLIEVRSDNNIAHTRFLEKWGFKWGVRNRHLRQQFEQNKSLYDKSALQLKFFELDIEDGPYDTDLVSQAPKEIVQ